MTTIIIAQVYFRTLKHLLLHLQRVSEHKSVTGMSSKNLAIVWTPNLFRTPLFLSHPTLNIDDQKEVSTDHQNPDLKLEHPKFQISLVQNTQIVQYLIENAATIFQTEPHFAGDSNSDRLRALNCDPSDMSTQRQIPLSKR